MTNAKNLIKCMAILEDVVLRENAALEAIQVEVFMALQEEKLAAAVAYQEAIMVLSAAPLPVEMRQKLTAMQGHFTQLCTHNAKALDRMSRCVDRLAGKICEAAQVVITQESAKGYDAAGGRDAVRLVSMGQGEVA